MTSSGKRGPKPHRPPYSPAAGVPHAPVPVNASALLAERLGVPKRQVVIVRGATSRLKVVEVAGLNPGDLRLRLA